ncbi:MAG TPA: tRNA (adenosine(37)-N6)-threonylcarbamoyltransferase complex transferase subunit TsaD [Planctomycetaceae bacterium]|nr:tRNA (adenosine(37)-N6)-threonylcarbamoyltransferase complex transferase subunit TsaD [Planctomycetaceae bacterium]
MQSLTFKESSSAAPPRLLLAIESSCDETAAAVIDEHLNVRSNVVASQAALHERFGGVVPEIASRAHVERILPVIDEALQNAGTTLDQLAGIAVVTQPGLVGSLLVGLTAAKTLAWALDLPLVGVDHLQAHLFACRMAADHDVFPAIGFVVSGGHSNLYDCRGPLDIELIGATIDDAAGEAFDKVASILGLEYPGGPSIERCAKNGRPNRHRFPRAFIHESRLDFSFSGLKTAVLYEIRGQPPHRRDPATVTPQVIADVAAAFQEAVVDVLVKKCRQALEQFGRKTLLVGGGVAANSRFRDRLAQLASEAEVAVVVPPLSLCTDNAAMAAVGWELLNQGRTLSLDVDVTPGLVRLP